MNRASEGRGDGESSGLFKRRRFLDTGPGVGICSRRVLRQ